MAQNSTKYVRYNEIVYYNFTFWLIQTYPHFVIILMVIVALLLVSHQHCHFYFIIIFNHICAVFISLLLSLLKFNNIYSYFFL